MTTKIKVYLANSTKNERFSDSQNQVYLENKSIQSVDCTKLKPICQPTST